MTVSLDPEQAETRVLHALIDFSGKDVLEVGCGDGRLTWRYAGRARSVRALDPDPAVIARARENTPDELAPIVSFEEADITNVALPHEALDVVVLAWSL